MWTRTLKELADKNRNICAADFLELSLVRVFKFVPGGGRVQRAAAKSSLVRTSVALAPLKTFLPSVYYLWLLQYKGGVGGRLLILEHRGEVHDGKAAFVEVALPRAKMEKERLNIKVPHQSVFCDLRVWLTRDDLFPADEKSHLLKGRRQCFMVGVNNRTVKITARTSKKRTKRRNGDTCYRSVQLDEMFHLLFDSKAGRSLTQTLGAFN